MVKLLELNIIKSHMFCAVLCSVSCPVNYIQQCVSFTLPGTCYLHVCSCSLQYVLSQFLYTFSCFRK
jgi:hypothetical protein